MFLDKSTHVMVIGDIMLDHQRNVEIRSIANEAPIPVYKFISENYSLGGSGNVVKNMHALGCSIDVFGVIGSDANGTKINELLSSMLGVTSYLQTLSNYPTSIKERTFCDNKIMFRCDHEEINPTINITLLLQQIEERLKEKHVSIIVLSDYNKGVLNHDVCQAIITLSTLYGVPTCVDPKKNCLKYKGCTIIKPNWNEACSLLNVPKDTSIEDVHKQLFQETGCCYSVITLAERGITLFDGIKLYHEQPTIQHQLIDVTGAGDIVCSIIACYLLTNKNDISNVLRIATSIATRSVEYPGTYTIQKRDIITCDLYGTKHIRTDQIHWIRELYHDKKIVFTNGCFDILHHGHIQLFNFCHQKGDIVVVGVNSDDSIRRLKGEKRPINPLHLRTGVLESIAFINHIIVFKDDSPYSILQMLRPDVIIKGADYQIKDIIGREFASEVYICPLVPDISSTLIIKSCSINNEFFNDRIKVTK
jgi:D-beta-D-heptose 7-phosphate kinase/D-beta-D-heptose 1-phosphate adenosyltransferase